MYGIFDNQFVQLRGYGLAAEVSGFDVYRIFGGTVHGFEQALERIETSIRPRLTEGDFTARKTAMRNFLTLYHERPEDERVTPLRKILAAGMLVAYPHMNSNQKRDALVGLPDLTPDQLLERVTGAWRAMMGENLPVPVRTDRRTR